MNGKVTKIVDLQALNPIALQTLKIENTTVLGGNLALTQRSLKTIWQPNFDGKIVILEEIGETPEQISSFLKQIKTVGLFNNIKAIIFGQVFFRSAASNTKRNIEDIEKELVELVNHYNAKNYLDLEIDWNGNLIPNVPSYNYLELDSKIGVEPLPIEAQNKFIIKLDDDDITRFEATLLHFYQAKYVTNKTKIIILWQISRDKITNELTMGKDLNTVIKEFAISLNVPVFKSEAFGHRSYNLPIPFGTPAMLYSEKLINCQGTCNGFILETISPFPK